MDINKEIGRRISLLRNKYLKMSQKEFGEKLDMEQENISRMENGITCPTIATIIKLHNLFNIDIKWLITGIKSSEDEIILDIDNEEEAFDIIKKGTEISYENLMKIYNELMKENNELKTKYIKLMELHYNAG